MLTIGLPGFMAFAFYAILFHLFANLIAGHLARRNPNSALARGIAAVS